MMCKPLIPAPLSWPMWINAIDSNKFVDTVYIDFSKAFDTVSHRKLLHKLTNYGISGNILQWFSGFLCDR